MNDDITGWTLTAVAAAIAARRVSPVEATRACLARIDRLDARLRSFITLDPEGALRQAAEREAELMAGRVRGPLHGVPLAYKDLCVVRGLPTTCGTKAGDYFVDVCDATTVARLVAAGAVTIGKLNMSELALGPFGVNGHHGDVETPWKAGHVAGGSSSGSGAAVAAGFVFGALGSDTGGSIRLPAACCGVVGVKPTYGRVSRAGVMPLSWSLDHVGPLARNVRDAAALLGVIAGHDPRDATSSRRRPGDYVAAVDAPLGRVRVGVPENFYFRDLTPDVERAMEVAIAELERIGATVIRLAIPDPTPIVGVSNILVRCESAAVHARTARERPYDLQPEVLLRIEPGFHIPAFDYLQAARLRARFARAFGEQVFDVVDVVVAPTIPEPAPAVAAVKSGTAEERLARMTRFSRLTRPFNALGLPVVSVPCGATADGRPLGLQLAARPFAEATLLQLAHAYEQAAGWHTRRPPLD